MSESKNGIQKDGSFCSQKKMNQVFNVFIIEESKNVESRSFLNITRFVVEWWLEMLLLLWDLG